MARKNKSARYTAVGFVVTKLGVPLAKRAIRKKARSLAGSSRRGHAAKASSGKRGRAGVAVGAALGAVAYLVSRGRGRSED